MSDRMENVATLEERMDRIGGGPAAVRVECLYFRSHWRCAKRADEVISVLEHDRDLVARRWRPGASESEGDAGDDAGRAEHHGYPPEHRGRPGALPSVGDQVVFEGEGGGGRS
jgi:hypothetical protein